MTALLCKIFKIASETAQENGVRMRVAFDPALETVDIAYTYGQYTASCWMRLGEYIEGADIRRLTDKAAQRALDKYKGGVGSTDTAV